MHKTSIQMKFRRPPDKRGVPANDFTPISWEGCFEEEYDLKLDDDVFHIYRAGEQGVVCCLLHGGGFSALSWALFAKHLRDEVDARVLAMDMRGHGKTHTSNDANLSADVLAQDVSRVVNSLFPDQAIVLIGHSMGGAIAVRVAHQQLLSNLVGLVVIDVVEGTALESLSSMQALLLHRPSSFPSLSAAIQYCRKSGQIRNSQSARISVIGQLKPATTHVSTQLSSHATTCNVIDEEEEEEVEGVPSASTHATSPATQTASEEVTQAYTWRIDLSSTEVFWRGWFEGLSSMFLGCQSPKLLLLAGVDRLDKDLTIGQMQGKFQLELLPLCGHVVHEDCPDKVASKLAHFLLRFKLASCK